MNNDYCMVCNALKEMKQRLKAYGINSGESYIQSCTHFYSVITPILYCPKCGEKIEKELNYIEKAEEINE